MALFLELFLKLHFVLTVFVYVISLLYVLLKLYKAKKGRYESICFVWAFPLALPMMDGLITLGSSVWIGITEILFGTIGIVLLAVHEIHGVDLAINYNK